MRGYFNSLLKGSHLAEEKVLLSRNNDFLSIRKHEENVSRVQETRLFHVGEVDDTIARRAKKRGAIQPALTIPEQTPDESGAVGQIDACMVGARFKKPNVRRSDQPALGALAQKDEVIQTKRAQSSWPVGRVPSYRDDAPRPPFQRLEGGKRSIS